MLNRKLILGGIGLSDFIVLHHLSLAEGQKMRRTDIAEKVGLTASGVTRLLLPMEKIGLVSREPHPTDARSSFVVLAPGGKTKHLEALERLEYSAEILFGSNENQAIENARKLLGEVGGKVAWN